MREIALSAVAIGTAVYIAYRRGYRHGWNDATDPRIAWQAEIENKVALKLELLDHLSNRSYVKLAPSPISGVGVFAVIDIPVGANPFCAPNAHLRPPEQAVELQFVELLRHCPPAVLDHLLEFHDSSDASGSGEELTSKYLCNATGLAAMDASWYLNHSKYSANVIAVPSEEGFTCYRTSRAVAPGEELLLDYRVALPSVWDRMERERVARMEETAA